MFISVTRTLLRCAALTAPVLLAVSPAAAQPREPERSNSYSGTLTPLNGSGVTGTFTIEQRGQGQIRVHIMATGLEPGPGPHLGHIHGLEGNQEAQCPTLEQDADDDGYVELAEGATTYGPIIIPLGDVDPDNDGTVDYTATFNVNKSSSFNGDKNKGDLFPLELREIVLHGMTVPDEAGAGTDGEVNGPNEEPNGYIAVLPVACGEIDQDARRMEFRTP